MQTGSPTTKETGFREWNIYLFSRQIVSFDFGQTWTSFLSANKLAGPSGRMLAVTSDTSNKN